MNVVKSAELLQKDQIEEPGLEYVFHPYIITSGDRMYNVITGEVIKNAGSDNERYDLIRRWFMVPKDMDISSLLYYVRQSCLTPIYEVPINDYTIFTTMRCNAACEYCFQHGGTDSEMSKETALDVASYIQNHADLTRRINLRWFGGEPLMNKEAITTICNKLRNRNISFSSSMSTNGDLLSEVSDAEIYLWNLRTVQLTIDYHGDRYSKVKHLDDGAYERLLDSLKRLEQLGIFANVRIHYHPEEEKENVLQIIEDLKPYKNVLAYVAMLYGVPHNPIEYDNLFDLENEIIKSGLFQRETVGAGNPFYCMADNKYSRCIRTDGSFTPCEHHFEGETSGSIHSDFLDGTIVQKWKTKRKYEKACMDCPLFPNCELLSNCPSIGKCEEGYRDYRIKRVKRALQSIGGSNEQRQIN